MTLNARKKRRAAREQTREDNKQKWCGEQDNERGYGYHGNYTGKKCPKCKHLR